MTSDAPYHDHPRAFVERVAQVLGGRRVDAAHVRGSVNSEDDRFLNQLFSDDAASDDDVDRALAGRPGFVWVGHDRPVTTAMQAMTSSTRARGEHHAGSDIREVRHDDDLAGWHDVYSEVLGAGPRSLGDWRRIHAALGPSGDRSLVLVLARVDGIPAATGGVAGS